MIIYYEDAWGLTSSLDGSGAVIESSDLRGWAWTASTLNGKSHYTKEARESSALISFYSTETQNAASIAEQFFELCENDLANKVQGRLVIEGWSLVCNVIAGEIDIFGDDYARYNIKVRSDNPVWRKTREWSIPPETQSVSGGLDYPHDFPFDYSASLIGQKTLINEALYNSEFQLVIYGPATNPSITIAGNNYKVSCVVPEGGILFVNSLNKGIPSTSIFLRKVDGTIENMFSKRQRGMVGSGDYIFEPIPAGNLDVTWSGAFGFDLYTYEGRSVLPWT